MSTTAAKPDPDVSRRFSSARYKSPVSTATKPDISERHKITGNPGNAERHKITEISQDSGNSERQEITGFSPNQSPSNPGQPSTPNVSPITTATATNSATNSESQVSSESGNGPSVARSEKGGWSVSQPTLEIPTENFQGLITLVDLLNGRRKPDFNLDLVKTAQQVINNTL